MAVGSGGAETDEVSSNALSVERAAWRFSFRRKLSPLMLMMVQRWSRRSKAAEVHDGVAGKDLGPVAEGFIRGEDDGAVVVVALRDHLKEETGPRLV